MQHRLRAGDPLQICHAADMIDMRVRRDDRSDGQSMFGERGFDAADIVAGIDDHSALGLLVSKNDAIALQHPDREMLDDHGVALDRFAAALARNGAVSKMNRSCVPVMTTSVSSRASTLKTNRRRSISDSSAVMVNDMPSGVAARCRTSTRVPTVAWPGSSPPLTHERHSVSRR